MKRVSTAVMILLMILGMTAYGEERVDTLTYAVYPYLPDPAYYQELIELRWHEVEPDIQLIRAEWDCYKDGVPEGVDVVMYDAVMLDTIAAAGWIQPIDPNAVQNLGDIFPFALEGLAINGKMYGIPVFLCGNFLIYDQDCEALAAAEHITDLAGMSEILVINSESPVNRKQYLIEVIADARGEANPSVDGVNEDPLRLIDCLAIHAHKHDDDTQVVMAYDSGVGEGYIGFSESMRLLKNRAGKTRIKSISFSDQPDTTRMYVDAVAVTVNAEGQRYEKSLELMNVMAEADVLTKLSVRDSAPQYLFLARRIPYQQLSKLFPLYSQMEELAGEGNNRAILTP